jgi:ribonuclease D
VLEKWEAPHGPNELKDKMKRIFQEEPRSYFETRPIVPEFLHYSARDVEDLIEVQEKMAKQDQEGIWAEVGSLYAVFRG